MAIKWSEALIAGAAGVAQYSNQEQERRQKRLDRTMELQNSMRMEQAKSSYAVKLNEYNTSTKLYNSLKGVEPTSFNAQYIIAQSKGLDAKSAQAAAQAAVATKQYMTMPEAPPALPELEIPAFKQQQASSPIQDWMRSYRDSSTVTPQVAPVDSSPTEPTAPTAPVAPVVNETPVATEGSVVPATPAAPVVTEATGATGTQAYNDAVLKYLTPATEYHITTQETVKNGKKATQIIRTDKQTGKTFTSVVPSDISSITRLSPRTVENQETGQVDTFIDIYDPESGKVVGTDSYTSKSRDKDAEVEWVTPPEASDYFRLGGDDLPAGQFYVDFSPKEQEAWEKLDQDSWFFKAAPQGLGQSLGTAYLQNKKKAFGSQDFGDKPALDANGKQRVDAQGRPLYSKIKAKHLEPQVMSRLEQLWKAQAYIQVMGIDGVVEAINKKAVPEGLFFGPTVNVVNSVQQIQKRLNLSKERVGELNALPFNNQY